MGAFPSFERCYVLILVSVVVLLGLFYSSIVPPFQSPDEFDHVKRAYLLSCGVVFLEVADGESSGGMIDVSLLGFMDKFRYLPFKPNNKMSIDVLKDAGVLRWSGVKEFSAAPGTGYYFPIIYAPQAMGLLVGRVVGVSVYKSYMLARFFNVLISAAVLYLAFSLWPCSPFSVSLFLLPMSVFQLSSGTIDFFSLALMALALSLFMRLSSGNSTRPKLHFVVMTGLVSVVSMCRLHMLPAFLLVAFCCFRPFSVRKMIVGMCSFAVVLSWTLYAVLSTVDLRVALGVSKVDIVSHYIINPFRFFEVLAATLFSGSLLRYYASGFLGYLGWLDAAFTVDQYMLLGVFLALSLLLSFSVRSIVEDVVVRSNIFVACVISVLLVFASLLISWSPHPATVIRGVQGRYFVLSMLLFSFSVSSSERNASSFSRRLGLLFNALLVVFDVFVMPSTILSRYYM